jgi:hypothetical protein
MSKRNPAASWNSAAVTFRARTCLSALALLVIGLVVAPHSKSQQPERILTGVVTDLQHEPLRGAIVQVEDQTNLSVVSYVTGKDGRYRFLHLQGNVDYRFWATFHGHRSKAHQIGIFSAKNAPVVTLVIKTN